MGLASRYREDFLTCPVCRMGKKDTGIKYDVCDDCADTISIEDKEKDIIIYKKELRRI